MRHKDTDRRCLGGQGSWGGGSGQAVFTLRSGKSRCSGLGTKVLIMT